MTGIVTLQPCATCLRRARRRFGSGPAASMSAFRAFLAAVAKTGSRFRAQCLCSPSTRPGLSPSSRIAPRWARASRPACRWCSPTSSTPTGRAFEVVQAEAMRNTATRTPTARAACASSTSPCAKPARRRGRCSRPRRRSNGRSRSRTATRDNHSVLHAPTGRQLGFGALVGARRRLAGTDSRRSCA